MQVYHDIADFRPLRNAVVTSGTFDGVHLGHQKILSRLREAAQASGGETVVITFWPHPRMAVSYTHLDVYKRQLLRSRPAAWTGPR